MDAGMEISESSNVDTAFELKKTQLRVKELQSYLDNACEVISHLEEEQGILSKSYTSLLTSSNHVEQKLRKSFSSKPELLSRSRTNSTRSKEIEKGLVPISEKDLIARLEDYSEEIIDWTNELEIERDYLQEKLDTLTQSHQELQIKYDKAISILNKYQLDSELIDNIIHLDSVSLIDLFHRLYESRHIHLIQQKISSICYKIFDSDAISMNIKTIIGQVSSSNSDGIIVSKLNNLIITIDPHQFNEILTEFIRYIMKTALFFVWLIYLPLLIFVYYIPRFVIQSLIKIFNIFPLK